MLIDTQDYLTIAQATRFVGGTKRAVYRAAKRARDDGAGELIGRVLGRAVIHKSAIPTLKRYYYPATAKHSKAMQRAWGRAGGLRKAANRGAGGRTSARSPSGTPGTAGEAHPAA